MNDRPDEPKDAQAPASSGGDAAGGAPSPEAGDRPSAVPSDPAAPEAGASAAGGGSGDPSATAEAPVETGAGQASETAEGEEASPPEGKPETEAAPAATKEAEEASKGGPRRKRRRPKARKAAESSGAAPRGRTFVEDEIDRTAQRLAREARVLPNSRLRLLGIAAQEIRRLAASGDPRDAREARRALVLLKSKVAFLAGREQGRERTAFQKVRDMVFKGVDEVTRNRGAPDPMQLRNFLDQLEAFVGYHRFYSDDRRRD